jgi:galactokinase
MNCFEKCQAVFLAQFGQAAERVFFAPGRINLIGEHTDYNGGHVFPCALTFGTYALTKKNSTCEVRLYSLNFPDTGCITFSLDNLTYQKEHDWANYPKGMIAYLRAAGYAVNSGMDILFYGEIPSGAGLSSSASIELVTGVLLKGIFNLPIEQLELVKLGKQVENNFIGVNSGIMDQFAIGMGKAGHGILLDCETLKYSYAPITIDKYNIVIMNTNKRRKLTDSKYNERRSECEAALTKLQTGLKIKSLGELDEQTFLQHQDLIGSSVLTKRARHAVTENARTLKALKALQQGNLKEFGELINQSHISLRDDYEVTGIELDTLAQTAWQQDGVLGARMTGAGFGGCAIAIVEKDQTASFTAAVGRAYKEKNGYEADFYLASIGDGAREITKEVNL